VTDLPGSPDAPGAIVTAAGSLDDLARLGPAATAVAAVFALIIGVMTVVQRARADRRDQWWKRARWAFDLTFTDDPRAVACGYSVLTHLAASELARDDEQMLLISAWGRPMHPQDEADGEPPSPDETEVDDDRGPHPRPTRSVRSGSMTSRTCPTTAHST
jgi:hypothetical protein